MNTYTLAQLSQIYECRYHLTEARFMHYFKTLYGWNESQCQAGYLLFVKFPREVYDEERHEVLDKLLPLVIEVTQLIRNDSLPCGIKENNRSEMRKLIHYTEEGESRTTDIKLNLPADVIAYGELLKRGVTVNVVLDYVEDLPLSSRESKTTSVFDGDIFSTQLVNWRRGEGAIYVCDKGTYRPLLYTKGKGYLRGGEPDYDTDKQFRSHVIIKQDSFEKIGNVYVDVTILTDGIKDNEI